MLKSATLNGAVMKSIIEIFAGEKYNIEEAEELLGFLRIELRSFITVHIIEDEMFDEMAEKLARELEKGKWGF